MKKISKKNLKKFDALADALRKYAELLKEKERAGK
jgi:hypothetical protein